MRCRGRTTKTPRQTGRPNSRGPVVFLPRPGYQNTPPKRSTKLPGSFCNRACENDDDGDDDDDEGDDDDNEKRKTVIQMAMMMFAMGTMMDTNDTEK